MTHPFSVRFRTTIFPIRSKLRQFLDHEVQCDFGSAEFIPRSGVAEFIPQWAANRIRSPPMVPQDEPTDGKADPRMPGLRLN
jgi:hypothetical protein